jgi:A/G-specific adenine glycosylase
MDTSLKRLRKFSFAGAFWLSFDRHLKMRQSAQAFQPPFSKSQKARITAKLIKWFQQHRRDLPWRQDRDPYRIWVSEVMLQQTTVGQVIPYFLRFLETFPNLATLAKANEETVLRHWEGLGYYRRARDLHATARLLELSHGGTFPRDPNALGELPGMGRYTRNAVLSQAFNMRLPIVETNSQRVLCRLFGQPGNPADSVTKKWLWNAADQLLPHNAVGDFNQALMELGALVCTPAKPRCSGCPLSNDCVAFGKGLQDAIPPAPRPPRIESVQEVAGVLVKGQRILLLKRPPTGRWANMWEFPHGPFDNTSCERALETLLRERCGLKGEILQEIMLLKHSVTRFRISVTCFLVKWLSGRFRSDYYQSAKWLLPRELQAYPVSVPQRRLAKMLLSKTRQPNLF